jgi:ADP-ribose pyrophosphatase YjhB (NUDIX family)
MGMSDFLVDLRSVVGNRTLLLPSVAVIVKNQSDEILLVRQMNTQEWSTVGGMVEPDEDPLDAVHREAFEETGIELHDLRLAGVFGGPGYRVVYSNQDSVSYVVIAYLASTDSQPAPDLDEVAEAAWFTVGYVASLSLSSLNRQLFHDLDGRI